MSAIETPPAEIPAVERFCRLIAIAGGGLSMMIAAMICVSVAIRKLLDLTVPGDFELLKMGTAITVFAFLPLGQIRRVNIVVDTFSTGWSDRARRLVDAVWDLVYAVLMGTIAYCMVLGSWETLNNNTATMVLQLKLWPALAVCTSLCALVALVSLWTAMRLRPLKP